MNRPVKVQCCECWRLGIPPTWLLICAAITVQVGFGLYPVLVRKLASDEKANPFVFGLYRDAGCFPLLVVCAFVAERKIPIPDVKTLLVFALLGLFGILGSQLLYILAIYKVGPDLSSAFEPIIPVWTAIIVIVTCTEKLPSPLLLHTWAKVVGVLLATGGAIETALTGTGDTYHNGTSNHTLTSPLGQTKANDYLVGYICLIFNTLCKAIYLVIQKKAIFNRPACKWRNYPISMTAYTYLFGAIFMAIPPIILAAKGETEIFRIPEKAIYALLYAVLINSALCYMLLTWANMYLSSIIVTALWPSQILVVLVAAYFITGDKLKPLQYPGVVMLIMGLMLVLFANYMDGRQKEGKAVIRLDSHPCFHTPGNVTVQKFDKEPLLGHQKKLRYF